MARFIWKGERKMGSVQLMNTRTIRVPTKIGVDELIPVYPEVEFVIGDDIGYEISDERSLRILRSDNRFEEIL